jgi:hypothetical protein
VSETLKVFIATTGLWHLGGSRPSPDHPRGGRLPRPLSPRRCSDGIGGASSPAIGTRAMSCASASRRSRPGSKGHGRTGRFQDTEPLGSANWRVSQRFSSELRLHSSCTSSRPQTFGRISCSSRRWAMSTATASHGGQAVSLAPHPGYEQAAITVAALARQDRQLRAVLCGVQGSRNA